MNPDPRDFDQDSDYWADDPDKQKPGAYTRDRDRYVSRTASDSSFRESFKPSDTCGSPPFTARAGSESSRQHGFPRSPYTNTSWSEEAWTRQCRKEELLAAKAERDRDRERERARAEARERERETSIRNNARLGLPPPDNRQKPLSERFSSLGKGTASVKLNSFNTSSRMQINIPKQSISYGQAGRTLRIPETNIYYHMRPDQLYDTTLPPDKDLEEWLASLTVLDVVRATHAGLSQEEEDELSQQIITQACESRWSRLPSWYKQSRRSNRKQQHADTRLPRAHTFDAESWHSGATRREAFRGARRRSRLSTGGPGSNMPQTFRHQSGGTQTSSFSVVIEENISDTGDEYRDDEYSEDEYCDCSYYSHDEHDCPSPVEDHYFLFGRGGSQHFSVHRY